MSVILGFLSALRWGSNDLFAPVSFYLHLGSVLLTSLSGALFAFVTYALYQTFQIGPIRLAAPIIGHVRFSLSYW